jgi:hypothetical protein
MSEIILIDKKEMKNAGNVFGKIPKKQYTMRLSPDDLEGKDEIEQIRYITQLVMSDTPNCCVDIIFIFHYFFQNNKRLRFVKGWFNNFDEIQKNDIYAPHCWLEIDGKLVDIAMNILKINYGNCVDERREYILAEKAAYTETLPRRRYDDMINGWDLFSVFDSIVFGNSREYFKIRGKERLDIVFDTIKVIKLLREGKSVGINLNLTKYWWDTVMHRVKTIKT